MLSLVQLAANLDQASNRAAERLTTLAKHATAECAIAGIPLVDSVAGVATVGVYRYAPDDGRLIEDRRVRHATESLDWEKWEGPIVTPEGAAAYEAGLRAILAACEATRTRTRLELEIVAWDDVARAQEA